MEEIIKAIENEDDVEIMSFLSSDLKRGMEFILNSTDQEFYKMASVFPTIARMTQSYEFVDSIKTRFINVTDITLDFTYLRDLILDAESYLPEEEI